MKSQTPLPNPPSPKVTWPAVTGAAIGLGVTVAEGFGVDVPASVPVNVQWIALAVIGWLVTDPLRQPPEAV